MKPTSDRQFASYRASEIPALESVRDDVWSLGMAMPSQHLPFSYAYLLRDTGGAIHVVDPGWETDENWATLVAALAALGHTPIDVRSTVATHFHPDHVGMAARLHAEIGTVRVLHRLEQEAAATQRTRIMTASSIELLLDQWGVPADRRPELLALASEAPISESIDAEIVVDDGDRLDIPGFDLVAMWTPGHTSGHLCLRDDARSLMYTGDHLLPTVFGGLGLGGQTDTNPLADYLAGLARISEYPEHEVLPGHGYRFTGMVERAAQSAEHHLRRSREVKAALSADAALTPWQVASGLTWTAGWPNLHDYFLYSALSQTAMHTEYVTSQP